MSEVQIDDKSWFDLGHKIGFEEGVNETIDLVYDDEAVLAISYILSELGSELPRKTVERLAREIAAYLGETVTLA